MLFSTMEVVLTMPSRLAAGEKTVKLQVALPASLMRKISVMAKGFADGNVSSWLREVVRREWRRKRA